MRQPARRILSNRLSSAWLQDCKSAVWFLRRNAELYGIAPEAFAALGGSAGGHLAAMLSCTGPADGFDPPELAEARYDRGDPFGVQAVGSDRAGEAQGPGVPGAHAGRNAGPGAGPLPRRLADHVRRSLLGGDAILHGTADEVISFRESVSFAEELRKRSVHVELELVEGAVHSFDLEPPQRDLRPVVLGFLERALRSARSGRALSP